MKMNWMKHFKLLMFALFMAVALIACGSSGGGSKDNGPDGISDPDPTPAVVDTCPLDPDKTEPGVCGCGVADTDSDSDGTPDCNDSCDNDPDKTNPGVCGCGTADTDSDGDGTPDCEDSCEGGTDSDSDGTDDCDETCDNDPDKTEPGDCGCGIADTDSDSDGTADCNETCDNDPNKTEPGICDCGTPDTDEDQDGVIDCLEPHYVAVGDNGTIISSIDGMNWDVQNTGSGEKINDVASGSWIGVGQNADDMNANGRIAVVDDAFNPTFTTLDPARELFGIANDGNDMWIAVGSDWPTPAPVISITTDDGANWTHSNLIPEGQTLVPVAALYEIATDGDSNWIAVGQGFGSVVSVSDDDGTTWDMGTINSIAYLNGIAVNDERWITVGSAGGIAVSDDTGDNWTDKSLPGTPDLIDVANDGDSTWVIVGMGGTVAVSTDNGDNWTSYTIDNDGKDLNGVVYGDDLWVIVGTDGELYHSSTAADSSWTAVTGLPVENLRSVAYKE